MAEVYGINGPVVTAINCKGFKISELVYVSQSRLIGEVIELLEDYTMIQVFEDTDLLKCGDKIYNTGEQLSVELAPGLLSNIFDGIQRPLKYIEELSPTFIKKGINIETLDRTKKWPVNIIAKLNAIVAPGDIIATVQETKSILHKIMVPHNIRGKIIEINKNGNYTLCQTIATLQDSMNTLHKITMLQKWPIRLPRPSKQRLVSKKPLITGQRIIDTLFPIALGGSAAVPGGFGTGKTMTQHQLAKWSNADIIIYIGCGERGNEMTQVLEDFGSLTDPRTADKLMNRTILIANTSNMPVAAREASIYTGITIAEYYRDMGYHVAIMADSTSRWAEALRELSGRLEEMPAEEGFPAYLASRLSSFYERAGLVENINSTVGSVTVIGAVSPQGSDFSEPVTQNTKRFINCFWALDRELAYARHFPSINWINSYSNYTAEFETFYKETVGRDFLKLRSQLLRLLYEENKLMDIVKLIGADVLPDSQRLTLEISKVIKIGFIQQNAYHEIDTYSSLEKQSKLMEIILYLYEKCKELLEMQIPMKTLKDSGIFEDIIPMKYSIADNELHKFDEYMNIIDNFYSNILNNNTGGEHF